MSSSSSSAKQDESTMTTNQFGGDLALLPEGFTPQAHIHCMRCGNMFLLCQCEGLNHGEDMMYVMDPIPPHFTVMNRIQRWALLMSYHPLLSRLDAVQYVKDLSPSFLSDMEAIQPIIATQMEQYKNGGGLMEHCKKLFDQARLQSGYEQCRKDCDFVMEHFFKGNWGYPCRLEYTFLNNAVQMSGPEDFDAETAARFQRVFDAVNLILQSMEVFGCGFNFRMEELKNGAEYT